MLCEIRSLLCHLLKRQHHSLDSKKYRHSDQQLQLFKQKRKLKVNLVLKVVTHRKLWSRKPLNARILSKMQLKTILNNFCRISRRQQVKLNNLSILRKQVSKLKTVQFTNLKQAQFRRQHKNLLLNNKQQWIKVKTKAWNNLTRTESIAKQLLQRMALCANHKGFRISNPSRVLLQANHRSKIVRRKLILWLRARKWRIWDSLKT